MENKRWEEKKSVKIINNIVVSLIFFTLFIYPVLVYHIIYFCITPLPSHWLILPFVFTVPFILIINFIGEVKSDKNKFSREFIRKIQDKLHQAVTLDDLYGLLEEFEYQAVEKNQLRLSYQSKLRSIYYEIENKIDILEKQK